MSGPLPPAAYSTGFLYNISVMTEITYTKLRETLASVLDQVVTDRETVIIRRKDGRDVALITATELSGLRETAHLLRSPKNAARLFKALKKGKKDLPKSSSVKMLREESDLV